MVTYRDYTEIANSVIYKFHVTTHIDDKNNKNNKNNKINNKYN